MKLLVSNNKNIDLHIHTSCSDGLYDPSEIIEECNFDKPFTIAITDHDTMKAYNYLNKKELKENQINLITGVEITTLYKDNRIHLLMYGINPKMFELLKCVYYKHYKGHINKYMSAKNVKRLAYILNGKVIIAHPYKYGKNTLKGIELVESLIKDKIIDGIECFHPYQNQKQTESLLKIANENDMYVTLGSDFHYYNRQIHKDMAAKGIGYLDSLNMTTTQAIEKYENYKIR